MNTLKSAGTALLGIAIFIGVIVAIVLLFSFGAGVAFAIAPFINWLAGVLFVINLFLLLVAIVPQARGVVGAIIYFSSYVYGLSAWIYGLAVTLSLWGWIAVIIGLFMGGIGVVPIGMLAAIFNGEGGAFWTLLITIVLTYGMRILGYALAGSADNHNKQYDNVIDVEPQYTSKRSWGDVE
jgi:hypothetical protein